MQAAEDTTLDFVISLHRLLRSLGRAGPGRTLQPTQLIVLAVLNELGPSRIGVIANKVPCSQPTATTAVAGLQSAGFVWREPDPADGRATRVGITEQGAEALSGVAHSEAETLDERLGLLPAADTRRVLALSGLLRQLADPHAAAPARDGGPLAS